MHDSTLDPLISTARLLRPLLSELVFVGGSVTSLLVTDQGAAHPRVTRDVDAVAAIGSYAEYAAFGERLRELGFSEDTSEDAPACRWVHSGNILDIMPLDESILGFSNRWYRAAMDTAARYKLVPGLEIRLISAPVFVATKLEAFKGRGGGDIFSHDLEDAIAVIDGRETLLDEVRADSVQLRAYLKAQVSWPRSPGFSRCPPWVPAPRLRQPIQSRHSTPAA